MTTQPSSEDVTRLLETFSTADARPGDALAESTYHDLRRLAQFLLQREPPGQTLQATALVNEAYLKLVGGPKIDWESRRHFINTVARAMRQVLIDRARRYACEKHGGDRSRVELSSIGAGVAESFPVDRAAELEEAVAALERANRRWAEIVQLRFFIGLTIEQTAEVMEISPALVKKDWRFARAWLLKSLSAA